ncbi:ABC-type lipoprotein export system ATPase subunit [Microbacterium sp. AG1240]|uniref:ABC transporter ATP-binding protein n=1 Tax=Microbacterium sp. AG1240 TaxID=2183992 RepID=UPI000EAC1018|nr:ABC transporter ATP-binding protein [Microbacterium sp. AG1240]RKT36276.1 ABC-type lipoprotein export system ATPase subunit [Microbacterium sp. AG1240]
MNAQHPPLIDCADVVRIYRSASVEVQALQGLNLRVDRGELTAIVGASGSGKSTLLGILSALDVASAGRVRVGDHDLMSMNAGERARYRREAAGFIWQQTSRNFVEGLSILENIELAASLTGGGRRRRAQAVHDVVRLLDITAIAERDPAQVTGGERQRAAIAVGLVNAPEVLFADEPTGELDERSSAQVLEAMRSVNVESGVTVLIVTHDPDVADHVRRTVQIRDGRTSTEVLRSTRIDEAGVERGISEEFAVLDRAGRLQLPQDQLARLGMHDRVRLGFRERHIEIHAGDQPDGDPR